MHGISGGKSGFCSGCRTNGFFCLIQKDLCRSCFQNRFATTIPYLVAKIFGYVLFAGHWMPWFKCVYNLNARKKTPAGRGFVPTEYPAGCARTNRLFDRGGSNFSVFWAGCRQQRISDPFWRRFYGLPCRYRFDDAAVSPFERFRASIKENSVQSRRPARVDRTKSIARCGRVHPA